MCDNTEKPIPKSRELKKGFCHKCKESLPKVNIGNTQFCKQCFRDSVIHRFRNNLFKLAKIPSDPKVLLAISGGSSSMLMLDLMATFCKVDPTHKNRVAKFPSLQVVHVDQSSLIKSHSNADLVQRTCLKLGIQCSIVQLESIFIEGTEDSNSEAEQNLKESLDGLTFTSKEDLLRIYTKRAIEKEAKGLGCNMIFYGHNSTHLAITVLANTAKGRGISLPLDLALESEWEGMVNVLPLRDVLSKEIGIFNEYFGIETTPNLNLTTGMPSKVSIDRITADFITGLQSEFPFTVSTVTRTAFKIPLVEGTFDHCSLCNGPIDRIDEFAEIESTTFQSNSLESQNQCGGDCNCSSKACSKDDNQELLKTVCYGCRNILRENGTDSLIKQIRQQKLKNEIQEFLL